MKSDLELLEECLEKAKKTLMNMETEHQQLQATRIPDGLFSSIGMPNITHQIKTDELRQKITVLEAQRAQMLRDNKEETLIIGNIEEISQYLAKNIGSAEIYKLIRVRKNENR